MVAKLGSYQEAHTSLLPLTASNSRIDESTASGTLGLPPMATTQISWHHSLLDPPVGGGGPLGRWSHVTYSGYAIAY